MLAGSKGPFQERGRPGRPAGCPVPPRGHADSEARAETKDSDPIVPQWHASLSLSVCTLSGWPAGLVAHSG